MIRRLIPLILAACVGLAASVQADEVKVGNLVISDAWARPSPGQPRNGAVFMTIANVGGAVDRLLAASSPVAANTLLHKSSVMSGLLKMAWVGEIGLEPGIELTMSDDGFHIMLVALEEPLRNGQTIALSLTFEEAGKVELGVTVMKDRKSSKSIVGERQKKGF